MCTLCHGATYGGGIGPSCTSCHVVNPVVNPSGCVSCHNLPPNGGTIAGNVRPNRQGRHGENRHRPGDGCAVCHNTFAYRTPTHFDFEPPASVVIQANYGSPAGTGTYNPANGGSCTNISCHGSGTTFGPWYQ
jgi:hypothetical protein